MALNYLPWLVHIIQLDGPLSQVVLRRQRNSITKIHFYNLSFLILHIVFRRTCNTGWIRKWCEKVLCIWHDQAETAYKYYRTIMLQESLSKAVIKIERKSEYTVVKIYHDSSRYIVAGKWDTEDMISSVRKKKKLKWREKGREGRLIWGAVRVVTYLCRRAFDFGDRVFLVLSHIGLACWAWLVRLIGIFNLFIIWSSGMG